MPKKKQRRNKNKKKLQMDLEIEKRHSIVPAPSEYILEQLAALGHADAQYGLALSYLAKSGTVDLECRRKWSQLTRQWSQLVNSKTLLLLRRIIPLLSFQTYPGIAGMLLLFAAIQGNVDAQYELAFYYIHMLNLPKCDPDVVDLFEAAATSKPANAQAQCIMAEFHRQLAAEFSDPKQKELHTRKTIEYLELAAASDLCTGKDGDPMAQAALARFYIAGTGVKQDIGRAQELVTAANEGWKNLAIASRKPSWNAGASDRMEAYLAFFGFKLSDFIPPIAEQGVFPVSLTNHSSDELAPKNETRVLLEEAKQAEPEQALIAERERTLAEEAAEEKRLEEQVARKAEKETREREKIAGEKEKLKAEKQRHMGQEQRVKQERQAEEQQKRGAEQLQKDKRQAEKQQCRAQKQAEHSKQQETEQNEKIRACTLTEENEKIFAYVSGAENGDAEAQFNLARHFDSKDEDGRVRNKYGAERLYKAAAAQGHPGAQRHLKGHEQYKLGRDYEERARATQDKHEAAHLYVLAKHQYKLAVAQGDKDAQRRLILYSEFAAQNTYTQALDYEQLARQTQDMGEKVRLFESAENLYKNAAAQGDARAGDKLWLYEIAACRAMGLFKVERQAVPNTQLVVANRDFCDEAIQEKSKNILSLH